jgi:hypothetical protein
MTVTKISDKLYISNAQEAYILRHTYPNLYIMTCAFDSGFTGNIKFDLIDGPAPDNDKNLFKAINHLSELQNHNIQTLVHCVSGVSRSCAVVTGYLMKRDSIDFFTAYDRLRKYRSEANIVNYFVEVLGKYVPKGVE